MAALKEITNIDVESLSPQKKVKNTKRLSVERIYQKKTQLEHILLRPDSYIGSVEPISQSMWVWDKEAEAIVQKTVTFTPGLYKIFDEIIVNAADNKQRDKNMDSIKINIDGEKNIISIWNNGKGIPVEMHKDEKLYVPSMIFGHLLTSSNYDDTEKKVTGGRNGFGAKLCNIFSTMFTVETATDGKKFKQTWKNNMSKAEPEKIVDYSGTDYTCISFSPDLPKFKMEKLDDDTVSLLMRRAYDMAGVCRGVGVTLNGQKLKIKSFKQYVDLYLKGAALTGKSKGLESEDHPQPKVIHELVNPRWEIAVTVSDSGFQQVSFVNSIATTKGGTHVNYCVDQICDKLMAVVKKKTGKGGFNIKPFQIKSHIWVFVNSLVENPTFDSQTKENMTLRAKSFGSVCELSDKYIKQVQECGVLDNIMSWVKYKSEAQLNKKCSGAKHSKLKGVPKLDDANNAGTKHSRDCTLIVTEGDSAKTLAMAGLGVVGRDKYGVFPLRGKMLNVRDATHKQIMENAEIGYLLKIIGLQFGKKYETEADLKSLRYGHLMIMTDQDQDGSHIKGLVINFIHAYWPGLLKLNFIEQFITPIVKVTKGAQTMSFFSLPEFEEWKSETPNHRSWRVRYYKGLGSSTSKEGKEYFANMQRHRIQFQYDGPSSDQALIMAFSRKMVNERKDWLTSGMNERKMRREAGMPEIYLYEKNTRCVTYKEFVNKELILFSNADNERSIPSLVDGLKPGQRKVMFTCFKRNDKNEVKVAQLAGSVAELSAYHHGEVSLMSTIINLAQNFVGSNNLNLLQPIGQFGSRHQGGKDSASPRYIHTMLSPLARLVFPVHDDNLLTYLYEDNQRIEPEWYCPILPMVLVNGADGIGTGYATKIPNYDVREIVSNLKRMINGEELQPMLPSYKNFTGEITQVDDQRYVCQGVVSVIDESTIEISELPIKSWTQGYKESVMDIMLYGNEKVQPYITDYKEYHNDSKVRFEVIMSEENLAKAEQEGFHAKFKLETYLNTSSMVLFDQHGVLRKYESATDIIREFFELRMQKYRDRKAFLMGMLEAEAAKLENQARFILEKIEGKVIIENRAKRDVISTLVERGYLSDPIKAWKASQAKQAPHLDDDGEEAESNSPASSNALDFQYLLGMAIMSLSKEKKDELLKQRDEKRAEVETLRQKTPEALWLHDLDTFLAELERVEEQERIDDAANSKLAKPHSKSAKGRVAKPKVPDVKSKDTKKGLDAPSKAAIKKARHDGDGGGDTVKAEPLSESAASQEAEPLSLADRLKSNVAGARKQSTLKFGKAAAKKTKKKKSWGSDSDSDDDDDFEIEDFDNDDWPPRASEKREIKTREAKVHGAGNVISEKTAVEDSPMASDDMEPPSLADRLKKNMAGTKKQSTLKFGNSSAKKKKSWDSDSDCDEDEDFLIDSRSDDDSPAPVRSKQEPKKPEPKPKGNQKVETNALKSDPQLEPTTSVEPLSLADRLKKNTNGAKLGKTASKAAKTKKVSYSDSECSVDDVKVVDLSDGDSPAPALAKQDAKKKDPKGKNGRDGAAGALKSEPQKSEPTTSQDPDPPSLADRLNKNASGAKKQSTLKFGKPAAKNAKKKKALGSDSDCDDDEDFKVDTIGDDDSPAPAPARKREAKTVKGKPAAKKARTAVESDEDSFHAPEDSSGEDVPAPVQARAAGRARAAASQKKKYTFSSEDDESDSDFC